MNFNYKPLQFLLPLLCLHQLLQPVSNYCVDYYCPYNCCKNFYSCGTSADCRDQKPYSWPYPNGNTCKKSVDCLSDCCYSKKCSDLGDCKNLAAILGGVFACVISAAIIVMIYRYCRRRYRREKNMQAKPLHDENEHFIQGWSQKNQPPAQNYFMPPTNFNPNLYVEQRLDALNLGNSEVAPFKPAPYSNYQPSVLPNFPIFTSQAYN